MGDMRTVNLGQRFDGIVAWDSFFHLGPDDQRAMFPRFAAHARPGAPLMFTSGTTEGEAIGSFCDEPLYHSSLATAEYEHLLTTNGFAVREYLVDDPHCGGHTVWLATRDPDRVVGATGGRPPTDGSPVGAHHRRSIRLEKYPPCPRGSHDASR